MAKSYFSTGILIYLEYCVSLTYKFIMVDNSTNKLALLVGAGRSGTTLLYKCISLHPEAGYISNYDERLPSWMPAPLLSRWIAPYPSLKAMTWFKGGNAYFDSRPYLKRLLPTPAEGEIIYHNCGLPLIPQDGYQLSDKTLYALQQRFNKLTRLSGSRVFLSKRTANNRRIAWLNEAFPDALYIHLIRDGRAVAHSLGQVKWWGKHKIWWADATVKELTDQGYDPLEICAKNWVEEVKAIKAGLETVPSHRKHELHYEALMDYPLREISKILNFLGLSENQKFGAVFSALNLKERPEPWRTRWSKVELDRVTATQEPLLREFGYL